MVDSGFNLVMAIINRLPFIREKDQVMQWRGSIHFFRHRLGLQTTFTTSAGLRTLADRRVHLAKFEPLYVWAGEGKLVQPFGNHDRNRTPDFFVTLVILRIWSTM